MRSIGRGLRRIELLARHDLLGHELLHARQVSISLDCVGTCGTDVRVERGALARGVLHLCLCLTSSTGAGAGGCEVGICLREFHGILALVDSHEHRIGAHILVLGHVHASDVTAHLGEHGNEVPVDLCVIRAFVHSAVEVLLHSPRDADDAHEDDEREHDASAVGRSFGWFCCSCHDFVGVRKDSGTE